jgi:hypothetical protein
MAAIAELNLTLWEIPIKIFLFETICSIRDIILEGDHPRIISAKFG